MSDPIVQAAKRAAGVETGPRMTSYVHPRHRPAEPEPVEEDREQEQAPTPPQTTSTRPLPAGEQGWRPTPVGGSEPYPTPEPDVRTEARAAADRAFARQHGDFVEPTPVAYRPEGWRT